MFLLEVGDLSGLIALFGLFWIIPIIMLIVGLVLVLSKKNIKRGKVLMIISGVWLVIGLGICGALIGAY